MQINFLAKIVRVANDFDIIYRKLVDQKKFEELKNILPLMRDGKIQDGKMRDDSMGESKPKEIYDRKILSMLTKAMFPEQEDITAA